MMKHPLIDLFTSKGYFLDQKISLHVCLQKGRENPKRIGNFAFDWEECGNLARKGALLLLIFGVLSFFCVIKNKNSSKTLDK